MSPQAVLLEVAQADRVDLPVAVVVAHQDDETLGLGARFSHLRLLTLIHLTDGAPRRMRDAHKAGFESREAYAQARAAELNAALRAAKVDPVRRVACGVVDQEVVKHLPELIERLAVELREQAAVVTHPYEGGHPDHDGAALAVQLACLRLGTSAPVRLEFAGYHLTDDGPVTGRFFEGDGLACAADDEDRGRKRAALAAFSSQKDVLAMFADAPERLRLAPEYDFSRPPASGRTLYDLYGWELTSASWRERVSETLACA